MVLLIMPTTLPPPLRQIRETLMRISATLYLYIDDAIVVSYAQIIMMPRMTMCPTFHLFAIYLDYPRANAAVFLNFSLHER